MDEAVTNAQSRLAALRQQVADMERGVADALNGAIGDQDMGVVAGVGLLAERYAAERQRHAAEVEKAFYEGWDCYDEDAKLIDAWLASEAKARLT